MSFSTSMARGVIPAIGAAFLFGVSTPAAKELLRTTSPFLLAGLLYLGSGAGLGLWILLRRTHGLGWLAREARLRLPDLPWLAGAILCGGVLGPVLLMVGLVRTPASTASLLLNLEGVLTALLAWFVFLENFDRRIAVGMGAITAGGCILSWESTLGVGSLVGPLAIAGACLAWALDNNLTRRISGGDPVQIACIKGLVAGSVNATLALWWAGAVLPGRFSISLSLLVGFFGYGLSLVLFVLALRHIGTARTGAYFSLAPFIGAAISLAVLGEPISKLFIIAASLMGLGVWLHLSERHEHPHPHREMEHEHVHVHGEHHPHEHEPGAPEGEPHSHRHRHARLVHSHPHFPDIHHRHSH